MDLNKAIIISNGVLSDDSLRCLQNFVDGSTFPTTPSFVFDTQKSENVVDQTIRNSKTLHIKDYQLLSFVEQNLLLPIMEENPELKIALARDYVTFIKYDVGGFFDWHVDFEKVTVNGGKYMKEMHLLFCLQAPNDGGELLLKKNGETLIIPAPKTLNSVVIFDKLLEHRAEEVKAGQKIIMTVDVFVSTIYSDLSTLDEQRFIDFSTGNKNCFTIGSFEQFEKLYQQLELYKPSHGWIPFIQIRVESNPQIYEVDYIEGVGVTRFEEIERRYNWGKNYEKSEWYESVRLSRLNYEELDSDEGECEGDEGEGDEGEGEGEEDEKDEGDKGEGDAKKRKHATYKIVETVDAQTQTKQGRFIPKNKNDHKPEEIEKFEDFEDKTYPLFDYRSLKMKKIMDVICDFVESEHDDFNLQDTITQIKNPPPCNSDKAIISLPESTYFKNNPDNYEKDKVGFSYHCNESNYDSMDIKFRYGLVRFEESMLLPSKPSYVVEKK